MAEETLPPMASASADLNTVGTRDLPRTESVGNEAPPTTTPTPHVPEGAGEDGGDRGRKEGEGETEGELPGLSSERVNQLSSFLRRQQEVVYRLENISKYFSPDVQKVATKCWDQLHPDISMAIEGKYKRILEESSVADKLAKLDSYQSKHALSPPAWRPTGIPPEDCLAAESAEAQKLLPEFKTKLSQAQQLAAELEQRVRGREEELAALEDEIRTSMEVLQQKTASFAHSPGQQ